MGDFLIHKKKIGSSIKISIFSKHQKWFYGTGILFLFVSFFFDDQILKLAGSIRTSPIDGLMLFMTDFGLLYCLIVLGVYLLMKKQYKEMALIGLTGALSLEISYLAKVIFQTPRPFAAAIVATIPLTQASGYSMPSLHTAFCFSLWLFVKRVFPEKNQRLIAYAAIIIIALSRLYLGVHYLSDLIAGGMVGYFIAESCIYFEDKYKMFDWFIYHVKDKLELRRQIAHIFTGCTIILLLKLQLLNEELLFVILIAGGLISLIIRKYKIPFLYKILAYFERPKDLKIFPGKGSFFLVLGSLFALVLFKRDIAMASIGIMAVGDAITTIVGTYFGKIKNPLNPKKHLEGTGLAIIASTLVAFFFVDFGKAFLGSLVGMIFESISVPYLKAILDDNLVIPIVAGIVMTLLS